MNVNDPRWASIDAFVEENRDNILRDITRLVAVPSVEGYAEPGAPFGPGPSAALAKALEIAGELGLDTFNADGYIGWAETGSIADGQKFLGDHHPHRCRARGQRLGRRPLHRPRAGRLAAGPRRGRRQGPEHPLPVRAEIPQGQRHCAEIPRARPVGCQRGDQHARCRLLRRALPDARLLLYPDAEFPVCNGEKGGFNGEIVSPSFENSIITAFEGGVAHNAVPDRAACTVQVGRRRTRSSRGRDL